MPVFTHGIFSHLTPVTRALDVPESARVRKSANARKVGVPTTPYRPLTTMKNRSQLKPIATKQSPPKPEPVSPDIREIPLHETIAAHAYLLWQRYGCPDHRSEEIWLEAEGQVLGADPHVNHQATGDVSATNLAESVEPIAPRDATSFERPKRNTK
jgi:hypothetical protein